MDGNREGSWLYLRRVVEKAGNHRPVALTGILRKCLELFSMQQFGFIKGRSNGTPSPTVKCYGLMDQSFRNNLVRLYKVLVRSHLDYATSIMVPL